MLQNLVALRMNGYVYANHHQIRKIFVRSEDGVWVASSYFPKTCQEFVMLSSKFQPQVYATIQWAHHATESDMVALQQFYSIESLQESSKGVPAWEVENQLFCDIARTFGLTYWLQGCSEQLYWWI